MTTFMLITLTIFSITGAMAYVLQRIREQAQPSKIPVPVQQQERNITFPGKVQR